MPSSHPHETDDGRIAHDSDYSSQPLVVTWEVTQACALECDHCRADAQPDRHPGELTYEEGTHLLDQVADFGSPAPVLVFSGGDPLERPDLFDLLEYANEVGLETAVVPAPTSALTADVLDRFEALGVRRIALSLDGATADRHDSFRGETGSFDRIREAAAYAGEIGLSLQINTTVTVRTAADLPAIADMVADFDAVTWEVFFLVPIGRGTDLEQLPPERVEWFLGWLYRHQRTAPYRVITVEAPHYRRIAHDIERSNGGVDPAVGSTGDGNGFVFVSHTGTVYPSGFLPVEAGDVREDHLVDVYRDSPLLGSLRDPAQFSGQCGRCRYRDQCGGSRARAYATTGNPFASDPLCSLVAQHWDRAGD